MPRTRPGRAARPLLAGGLAALLLAAPVPPPAVLGPAAVLLAAPLLLLGAEEARAQRRSGGFARPMTRTPSMGGVRAAPRAPSVAPRAPGSGGYALPAPGGRRPSLSPGGSAADRAYGRERSGAALRELQTRQDALRRQGTGTVTSPSAGAPAAGGALGVPPGLRLPRDPGPAAPRGGGWAVPGGAYGGPRSFGMWDAAFLWLLLNNLNRPGSAEFFRDNQGDPGLRGFRVEAERAADTDPEIRRQLEELDRRLAAAGAAPPRPGALPPGVPPEAAAARDGARTPTSDPLGEGGGGGGILGGLLLPVLLVGGTFYLIARRRSASGAGGGMSGSGGAGEALGRAGAILRRRAEGEPYAPSLFRVGMPVTVDPTPFLLLGGASHLAPPAAETTSVQAVGRVGREMVRLHLAGGREMFQLQLRPDGTPEECRYFAILDEVVPADAEEWSLWLDPAEGMIGWPEFQTRDGRLYARLWQPGSRPVPPRELVEELETGSGRRSVVSRAMLYAAPTGAPAPAPGTEYVLVAAVEDGGRAWVEVRAGVDVSHASLGLA